MPHPDEDTPQAAAARARNVGLPLWPARLAEMVALLTAAFGPEVDAPRARRLAALATTTLCRHFGGSNWYVPKGASIDTALRDLTIWCEHDGTVEGPRGIRALARRHGISDQRVYAIIADQRAKRREQEQ